MDDELLTPAQRDPLLKMVKFQRRQGQDIRFTIPLGALFIGYKEEFSVMPPYHARELWEKQGYVFVSQGQTSWPDPEEEGWFQSKPVLILTLTQKAFDYERWLHRPVWQRWLIKQKKAWSSEARALLVSIIGGVTSAVLTVLILHWLGLT